MTNDEAIKEFQSELKWAELNTYPYISNKKVEADKMAIKILKQTRWIPVSERLPEKPYGCIVTVMDTNPMTCDEFENIYPGFVGWDGENWNDADGDSIPFEVIAWQQLPEPYKAESEIKE